MPAGASAGHDASDRLIFDTTTGNLYYDADGDGAGTAQLVATLASAFSFWPSSLAASDVSVDGTSADLLLTGQGNDTLTGFGWQRHDQRRRGSKTERSAPT